MSTSMAKGAQVHIGERTLDSRGRRHRRTSRWRVWSQEMEPDCILFAWTYWQAMSRTVAQSFEPEHMQGSMDYS